jgi:hypothetical protein
MRSALGINQIGHIVDGRRLRGGLVGAKFGIASYADRSPRSLSLRSRQPPVTASNGKLGNDLVAEGQAKPKPPSAYKIVGQSPPRFDVPAKVFGRLDYVTDITVPGMLHGRMIRPPVAGAMPLAVDGLRFWRRGAASRSSCTGPHP